MKKSTNRYKKAQLKKAQHAWGCSDMKSLSTILARLSPVMTVEAFHEYNATRAHRHQTIK